MLFFRKNLSPTQNLPAEEKTISVGAKAKLLVCVCGGDSGRENHCIYDQGKTLLGMFYPMHTGSKRVFDGPHKYVASNESRLNPIISKQTSWHPVKIGSAPHGLAKRCWHHKTGDSGPALAVPLDVCLRVSESPA